MSPVDSITVATAWGVLTASGILVGALLGLFARLTPNPSLKRGTNGRPPGPVWWFFSLIFPLIRSDFFTIA